MPAKINFTTHELSAMAKAYESGRSFADLASGHGCSKNTVRSALLKLGVSPNVRRSIAVKAIGRASARLGAKWTEETRARYVATRSKMAWNGRTGPHSEETKAKISAATKGKNIKHTPEQKKHIESVRQACKRFIHRVLRATGKRKTIPSELYVGYSTAQLVAHLGPRPDGAHIDHYVPIAEFLRRGIVDPRAINALPNLRWLDAKANQRKSHHPPQDADEIVAQCVSYTQGA